jgi:hypothetical protein
MTAANTGAAMPIEHPAPVRVAVIEAEPAIDVAEDQLERIETMAVTVGSGFAAMAVSILWIALAV